MNKLTHTTRKIFARLIIAAMVFASLIPATAFGGNSMSIYFNDKKTSAVAYQINNRYFVDNNDDLAKIFGKELDVFLMPEPGMGIELKYAVEEKYNCKFEVSGDSIYVSSKNYDRDESKDDEDEDRKDNDDDEDEDEKRTDVTVYLNDEKVKGIDAYEIDGKVYVDSKADLRKMFTDKEMDGVSLSSNTKGINLKRYAEKLEYDFEYVERTGTVYLEKEETASNAFDQIPNRPEQTTNSNSNTNSSNNTVSMFLNGTKVNPDVAKYLNLSGYKCIVNGTRIYYNNDGQKPIEVFMNGNLVDFSDQQPVTKNGRTLVPFRTIAEILDCKVTWDAPNKRVAIVGKDVSMALWIDSKDYWINKKYATTDVAPTIINARTMVPLRLVTESLGCKVTYTTSNGVGQVYITK